MLEVDRLDLEDWRDLYLDLGRGAGGSIQSCGGRVEMLGFIYRPFVWGM